MTISIKPISIVTFALLVFIPMLSFADPSGQVTSNNSNISPVFSPEDFGPSVCVGCCDENGNQLPSDPVCGCDPVDQCGVCNGDGSSCSCELFDCAGKPFPNPIPYCRLDVNKDKRIDLADDSALRAYTNEHGYGIPVDESNSMFDVTGDDKYITALDLLAISNFLNFPVDEITIVDACGVCGGSGKNECGKCPGDRDFAEPTGPDGICGCPDAINYVGPFNEECKICTNLPNDSCGRCPGSTDYGNSSCKSIDACEGLSIEDLAGKIGRQKHDGKKFNFNPSRMTYDPAKGIWYDDQGGSTWACQKNSVAQELVENDVDLVYNFFYVRSGASSGNVAGRINFADTFLGNLSDKKACFVCGLIRHKKGCFPPGTLVAAKDGSSLVKVEEVRAGDLLWNPITKMNSKVISIIEGPEEKPLVAISANGLTMKLSSEHPVVTKRGLIQAVEVKIGDILFDGNGNKRVVDKIESLSPMQAQTVINFIMERVGNEHDGLLLVEGLVVGDLVHQRALYKK